MDHDENISPEEKLLRLIRKGKKSDDKNIQSQKTPKKKTQEVKGRSSYILLDEAPFIKYLNAIFLFILCTLIGVFLLSFLFPPIQIPENKVTDLDKSQVDIFGEDFARIPYSEYKPAILNRELFGDRGLEDRSKDTTGQMKLEMNKMIKDLTLIGILAEEEPQAIIEDKKSKKTYFLKRGDFLGNLKLIEIYEEEGKIIFEYEGDKVELYL